MAEVFRTSDAKAYDFVEQHAEFAATQTHLLRANF
jgi:hypothetical protein